MNKQVLVAGAMIGMTGGAFLPMLWGDKDMFGLASILCSMIGGFVGIWLGIVISRQFG
jgi:hypothetical protein